MTDGLRRRLSSRGILVALAATLVWSPLAAQNSFQEPWEGRWAFKPDECSIPIVLSKKEFDLSPFEARCTVRNVSKEGSRFVVTVRCNGEGGVQNARFKLDVAGDRLTFIEQTGFPFEPKEFQRCKAPTNRFSGSFPDNMTNQVVSPRFINLNCRQGGCSWFAIKNREVIRENRNGKLIWVTDIGCYTNHADDNYPQNYSCRSDEAKESSFVVFCSTRFPAIAFKQNDNDRWLRNRLVISQSGVVGYLTSSLTSYLYACHDVVWKGENLDLLGAKLGYRNTVLPEQDQINSVLDLMR